MKFYLREALHKVLEADSRVIPADNTQVLAAAGWVHKAVFGAVCSTAAGALLAGHSLVGSAPDRAYTPVYICMACMAYKGMAEDSTIGSMAAVDSSCIDTVLYRTVQ